MSILIRNICGIWIIITRYYRNPEKYGVTKFGYGVDNRITNDKAVDYRRALDAAEKRWHR